MWRDNLFQLTVATEYNMTQSLQRLAVIMIRKLIIGHDQDHDHEHRVYTWMCISCSDNDRS